MKPFLLIATRAEDEPAQTEYETYLRLTGLDSANLIRVRLERDPMPDLDLTGLSGIIVGGSPYNASDPAEQKSLDQRRAEAELSRLLDAVREHDIPFFGACYGVGSLGVHIGATIDRTYGEKASAIPVHLTDAGRTDPLIRQAGLEDTFLALVGHKEAVSALPETAVVLGRGEQCPVQMFRVGTRQYATQFHPELDTPGFLTRAGFYRTHGYFEPDAYDDLVASLDGVDGGASQALLRAFVELFARNDDGALLHDRP